MLNLPYSLLISRTFSASCRQYAYPDVPAMVGVGLQPLRLNLNIMTCMLYYLFIYQFCQEDVGIQKAESLQACSPHT